MKNIDSMGNGKKGMIHGTWMDSCFVSGAKQVKHGGQDHKDEYG